MVEQRFVRPVKPFLLVLELVEAALLLLQMGDEVFSFDEFALEEIGLL